MKIQKMRSSDLDEVTDLAVQAFQNTALYKFVSPNAVARADFLRSIFRFRIAKEMMRSEIDLAVSDDRIIGVAVWVPPTIQGSTSEDHNSSADPFASISPKIKAKWDRFVDVLVNAKEKNIKQPCWSLSPIAVLPVAQGKGVASKLIREKLIKLDAENIPCYLATQESINCDIYNRYGFVTIQEDVIDNNLNNYTMVRPAKNS